jgi:hypothetical protein
VGADRRGPLAAFVIVALIAAILLVTSVRSQAAPWFSARMVAGPAIEPHLWGSVTGGVDQVVRDGTVLVRKVAGPAAQDRTRTAAASASVVVVTPRLHESPSAHHVAPRHHATRHHDQPGDRPANPPADHGRHLGWYQHHGTEQSADSTDGHDHGHNQGHNQGHGHGHGHAYGHSRH